jgi:hypothetical protein
MFEIGQKVVCIKQPCPEVWNCTVPCVGQVYTVRGIEDCNDGGDLCIVLDEILNPEMVCYLDDGRTEWGEPNFEVWHFRPVKTTSIEIFKKILLDTPKETEPV